MALASVATRALIGLDAPSVTVEVHVSNGLPSLSIVGLPETSVKESKDRVRSAIQSSGFVLPPKRITVNLAPADLPKSGGRYDLPIALGILLATEQLLVSNISEYEIYGELALTGDIRAVSGSISTMLASLEAGKKVIVGLDNQADVGLLLQSRPELIERVFLVQDLRAVCQVLLGDYRTPDLKPFQVGSGSHLYDVDMNEVSGQSQAKRALEISASGEHSMMLVGPPGAGKSMLASRLVTILPELSSEEAIEVAKIKSISSHVEAQGGFHRRPLIQPHHTASSASIVGGGTNPKPGALSLAHRGVLFLDELPEFNRAVLEALREPLETKQVNISRVNKHVTFPADLLLVAAMNPSPSGYFPDDSLGRCKDTPDQILRYQKRISGPLLDRIDLHLDVPAVDIKELRSHSIENEESSAVVRARVEIVRQIQLQRQGCFNSALKGEQLKTYCSLNTLGEQLIDKAVTDFDMSARGYHRILRVARTIADMENEAKIQPQHIAEALSYRAMSKAFS